MTDTTDDETVTKLYVSDYRNIWEFSDDDEETLPLEDIKNNNLIKEDSDDYDETIPLEVTKKRKSSFIMEIPNKRKKTN